MSGIEIINTFSTIGNTTYLFNVQDNGWDKLIAALREQGFKAKKIKSRIKITARNVTFNVSASSPTNFFLSPYIYINGIKHAISEIRYTEDNYIT